jgi:hypothetical protein
MNGRVFLAHVDLYRLSEREAERLGLEELRERAAWSPSSGESGCPSLARRRLGDHLSHLGPTARELTGRGR